MTKGKGGRRPLTSSFPFLAPDWPRTEVDAGRWQPRGVLWTNQDASKDTEAKNARKRSRRGEKKFKKRKRKENRKKLRGEKKRSKVGKGKKAGRGRAGPAGNGPASKIASRRCCQVGQSAHFSYV